MDWINRGQELFRKYRYVLLVLLIGMIFMILPEKAETQAEHASTEPLSKSDDPSDQLEQILSQIQGAGKVDVLLTYATGEEIIYQTNEDDSNSSDSATTRRDTVIITDSGRGEAGLIQTVIPPTYLGAIVVCQGADSPSVKLSIVEAVANATGLGPDRITVLKMK